MAVDVADAVVIGELRSKPARAALWPSVWPKVLAVALFIGAWQVVVWTHWKPEYVVPSPFTVLAQFPHDTGSLSSAVAVTMRRAGIGFGASILIGGAIGLSVARVRVLRAAIGSMITGLQTMPSVAWVPLAIVLFQLSERAILFVVILGAAPSIANGIIEGIDNVPPLLMRAGRVLGARGWSALRYVVVPAALPSVVGGLKQGWAFAWRSLMAGELITAFPGHIGVAQALNNAAQDADFVGVYEAMIVIFVIGVVVDAVFFGTILRVIRKRYGLIDAAAT
ncbi:MAG TPA: ABC transporter permease subunit [Acidimicrobiia bacterium]|jgi:NitT/TauT family transport system permease protein